MKVVLTITGSQRFGTDEPEKTSLVTEGTLEREGDILLLSYEESELTGMEVQRPCSAWSLRASPCSAAARGVADGVRAGA